MKENKIKGKDNCKKIGKSDAEKYGQYIRVLMKENGGKLTPHDIVNDAKRKDSILHDYFDWNDSDAAKKWRVQQARELIQNCVEVVVVDDRKVETRSFWSVNKGTNSQCYVTKDTALKVKSYRKELIANIITHLKNTQVLLQILQDQK
jgi:hypothetical protein